MAVVVALAVGVHLQPRSLHQFLHHLRPLLLPPAPLGVEGLGQPGLHPYHARTRNRRGSTSASAASRSATSMATCCGGRFIMSSFLEPGHDAVGPTDRHLLRRIDESLCFNARLL